MMKHEKYFKLPLKQDGYAPFIVWTSDDCRAFDFLIDDKDSQSRLIKKLNGEINENVENNLKYMNGEIFIDSTILLRIRSWGRLVGGGACGLSFKEASEIQDSFGAWIIKTLQTKSD
jgi:hypothetical protein